MIGLALKAQGPLPDADNRLDHAQGLLRQVQDRTLFDMGFDEGNEAVGRDIPGRPDLGGALAGLAIANSRLVSMADDNVTFRWRDYRHGRRPRRMTLEAGEFIRRFLLHTVPDGFHRIRHYGFLANGQRAAHIAACRGMLAAQMSEAGGRAEPMAAEPMAKVAPTARPCPCCGRPMITIAVWYHGQAPPGEPFWNDSS